MNETTPISQAAPTLEQPTSQPSPQNDAVEKFIERVIADAKKRPLVANIGVVLMGLATLSALCAAPILFSSLSQLADIADHAAFTTVAGFSALPLMILSAGAILGCGFATHGLYHMRRYGIYAVGAMTLLSLSSLAFAGMGGFSAAPGMLMYGALFYFLWEDRKKFA